MPNATLVNFAAGETSPRSRGRFDLAWFRSSCEKLLNFIPEVSGPARFRSGFKFVAQTRAGGVARLIPFQLNDSQAYMLEFTAAKMRVYKDQALLTFERTTVTAITKANPAVITVASTTGLANGDEVIITGIVGMEELNGRQVKLAGNSGSTYQLVDPVTGSNINSSSFTTYVSGGALREVYEITAPYTADELDDLQWAQNNDTMYITHPSYAPQQLTVDSGDVFTLAAQVRTADPFASQAAVLTLTGISLSSTFTIVSFTTGDVIYDAAVYAFAGVVGTTEINGGSYRLVTLYPAGSIPRAQLVNLDGTAVDSSAWTAYVSSGTATPATERPLAVGFYESRLGYYGTNQRPNSLFLSRAPDDADTRYNDFTGGTNPDDACFFTLAPVSGQVDFVAWGRGTSKYLFIGTFGGPFRVSGAGLDEPLSPGSINVRQFDAFGCEAVMPAGGSRLFFLQRGGRALRTARFDADLDDLTTYDMLLNAEHIADSRLRRVILQVGKPDVIWVTREDGVLAGMTIQGAENVAGWHRHKIGGTSALVLDVQPLPRTDRDDQLWVVSERTINGTTRRFVEVLADDVVFPDKIDFYTDADSEDDDEESWRNAVYRRQEEYVHLDAAGTYNGSDRGVTASATLTPGATTGTAVTFTASASVFVAGDVGKELWKKPNRDTGEGAGKATITGFTSATQVTCEIDVTFDAVTAIAAGDWYFAATTIFVPHLDGSAVSVVTDGAPADDETVAQSKITLDQAAAVVHVGLSYEGFLKTHNLELGGQSGPAQAKPRNVVGANIRFLNTLGVDFGTNIYDLEAVEWRDLGNDTMDRPAPPFSGIRKIANKDGWEAEEEKHIVLSQRLPLPCVVQFIDLKFETSEGS